MYRKSSENDRDRSRRRRASARESRYAGLPTFTVWRFAPSRRTAGMFANRVEILESGCWRWSGCADHGTRNKVLYGTFGNSKSPSPRAAHRAAYEFAVGPITDGLTIDHLCFNTLCVNPDHLEAVTFRENRMRAKARKTHCIHGHEYTPVNTYVTNRGSRECRTCIRANRKARRQLAPKSNVA